MMEQEGKADAEEEEYKLTKKPVIYTLSAFIIEILK